MTRWTQVIIGTAATLLATACAAPHLFMRPAECTPGICRIAVSVRNCETGDLKVVPPDVVVRERLHLEWTVDGDFEFLSDGIVVPNSDFEHEGVSGGGKKFKVLDKHDKTGTANGFPVKYQIKLKRTGGPACKPHDPTIDNQ